MSKVTVTGNVTDITGSPDPDQLQFFASEIRDGVLSTKPRRVSPSPTTGAFSVQLEAGPAIVVVRGKRYAFTAAAGDLATLLQQSLAVPPSVQKLQEAVETWATTLGDSRYATSAAVDAKYSKPGSGIPKADLVQGVRDSLDKADAAVSKTTADASYAPIAQAVPTGGSTGQVLTRTSGGLAWAAASGGGAPSRLPGESIEFIGTGAPSGDIAGAQAGDTYRDLSTNIVYDITGTPTPTAPGAPTNLVLTPGDGRITASWTAPTDTGGAAITDYVQQTSPDQSTWTTFADGTSTTAGATITGQPNGTAKYVRVAAVNSAGQGPWVTGGPVTPTAASDTTPPTTPSTPVATAGDGSATVTVGGSTDAVGVTSYRAYTSADGYTTPVASGSSSPLTVTGLTNGTPVTFKTTALDAAGNESAKSAASNSVTPTAAASPGYGVTPYGTGAYGQ